MKKALVLSGGGTKGSYQSGAIKALKELGLDDWDMVYGTSIGALNGTLVVQDEYDTLYELWQNLIQQDIIAGDFQIRYDLNSLINERNLFASFFMSYVKEKGADIDPFKKLVASLYNKDKLAKSKLEYKCICVDFSNQEPVFVDKKMMIENGVDWLLASSAAFPVFPIHKFNGGEYIDGGYFDNLPIDLALQDGADEIIAIDLTNNPHHPLYLDHNSIKYIFPRVPTGRFLDFTRGRLDTLIACGYNETMKAYNHYDGVKYTFLDFKKRKYHENLIRDILVLETQIKLANNINERFRSQSVITDRLKNQQHTTHISDEEIVFGLIDNLMDILEFDITKVYSYKEVRDKIVLSFGNSLDEDYTYNPMHSVDDLMSYASTLNQKGIIEKLVHEAFYPEHKIFPDSLILTIYPFEKALSLLVVNMMKELGDNYESRTI